jgi:hypothetical protein
MDLHLNHRFFHICETLDATRLAWEVKVAAALVATPMD